MIPTKAIEELSSLLRSHIRVRLLEILNEEGEMSRDQLQRRFECDRTTLTRNINLLSRQGWIRDNNQTCSITACGELVTEQFSELSDTIETAINLKEFMRWIPDGDFDLGLRHLQGADVVIAGPNDPYSAVNLHVEALKATKKFKGLLPAIGQHALETSVQRMKDEETSQDIVIEEDTYSILKSDSNYSKLLEEGFSTGRYTIRVIDEPIPFFLGIYDDFIHVGVEDDNGLPRGLLETGSVEARNWADFTFESYLQRAEVLD